MLQQQRHDIILSILAENGTVHTADLVKRMDVSSETIRKDLDYLEKAGQLTRVHGGAMPASDRDSAINPGYITLSTRKTQNVEQKKAIVQYALSMIEENQVFAFFCDDLCWRDGQDKEEPVAFVGHFCPPARAHGVFECQ